MPLRKMIRNLNINQRQNAAGIAQAITNAGTFGGINENMRGSNSVSYAQ